MDPVDRRERREMKRPPEMGQMKRIADAQALTLRPELRAVMRVKELSVEEVARQAKLDVTTLQSFLDGASINPRWQEKLTTWLRSAL